jgi:hypothetical protein
MSTAIVERSPDIEMPNKVDEDPFGMEGIRLSSNVHEIQAQMNNQMQPGRYGFERPIYSFLTRQPTGYCLCAVERKISPPLISGTT